MTDNAVSDYGLGVNAVGSQRDLIAGGLIGVGFLLNVDHVAALLARVLSRETAGQLTLALLVLYWGLWLVAVVWVGRRSKPGR